MGLCLGCERHCHTKHRCHDYEGYIYDRPSNCHASPRSCYAAAPPTQKYLSPPTNNYNRGYYPQYVPIPYSNPNLPSRVPYANVKI